jgi:hypothetical protein
MRVLCVQRCPGIVSLIRAAVADVEFRAGASTNAIML